MVVVCSFFLQAEDGLRGAHEWLEVRRVLFRSVTVTGVSSTQLASDQRPGWASASRYTNGLMIEPTGRCASTARLKPWWLKSRLPTTARTSPSCPSVIPRPACSGGRFFQSKDLTVAATAPSAYGCADGAQIGKAPRGEK